MDVAALTEPQSKTAGSHRAAALVEGNLFAELLDQHLVSKQNADDSDLGFTPADDEPSEQAEEDQTATAAEDDRSESNQSNGHPLAARDPLTALALLGAPAIPLEQRVSATQQAGQTTLTSDTAQYQVSQTNTPTTGQAAQTARSANNQHQSLETGSATNAPSKQQHAAHQPGAKVTAETNPELQSRPATATAASATSIQEQAQPDGSLREGRYDAALRHAQKAPEQAPQPNQPAARNEAASQRTVAVDLPDTQQTASAPQTINAVKPSPTLVGVPSPGTFQPGLNLMPGGEDTMKVDVAGGRTSTTTANTATPSAAAGKQSAARTMPPSQQVALQIRQAVKTGTDHIRIQLQPAELGKVDVQLTIRDEAVQAVVTVDRPEALEQLQKDSRQLIQALEDAGLRTNSDSLTFRHGHSNHHDPNNGTGPDEQRGANAGENGTETGEDPPTSQPRRHDGLISIEA